MHRGDYCPAAPPALTHLIPRSRVNTLPDHAIHPALPPDHPGHSSRALLQQAGTMAAVVSSSCCADRAEVDLLARSASNLSSDSMQTATPSSANGSVLQMAEGRADSQQQVCTSLSCITVSCAACAGRVSRRDAIVRSLFALIQPIKARWRRMGGPVALARRNPCLSDKTLLFILFVLAACYLQRVAAFRGSPFDSHRMAQPCSR